MDNDGQIWRQAILPVSANIGQVIRNLDEVAIKIVMIVDEAGTLQGTVCDGDIRRGLLKGLDLNSSISSVIQRNPLVVPAELERDMVIQLMTANKILQIPIVDEQRRIRGLHLWEKVVAPSGRPNLMVIMAGGFGTRLRPHTENCPKPLLMVGGRPMLEHIIERAKLEGFFHFVLAVHYLGHMIDADVGNGERMGVRVEYLREQTPLGTAGALGLLSPSPVIPFVVTNGDVITDIRYGDLLDFHIRQSAAATMAVRVHEWQHPFGVVRTRGIQIVGFEEKPVARTQINAGVYVLDPSALQLLRENEPCDMPKLFERLQNLSRSTVAYPMHEPWLDIGRPDDLEAVRSKYIREST